MLTQSEIVSEIVKFDLVGVVPGAKPSIEKLRDLSLQEMLDAVRQVERDNARAEPDANGSRYFSVVPDDRLVAAVYTWLHYCAPGYHDPGDDDDAIVHCTVGGHVHGLIKWVRPNLEVPT